MGRINRRPTCLAILFALMALTLAVSGCESRSYDAEWNEVYDKIENLKNEDAKTRSLLQGQMLSLRTDMVDSLTRLDANISQRLAAVAKAIQEEIQRQNDALRGKTDQGADALGNHISDWNTQLNDLITNQQKAFEKATEQAQVQLEQAIKAGDDALVKQISDVLTDLEQAEKILPTLFKQTLERMDLLADFQDRYEEAADLLGELTERRDALHQGVLEFQETIEQYIEDHFEEFRTSELAGMLSLFRSIKNEYEDYLDDGYNLLSDCENVANDFPDIESLLSDAEAIMDRVQDFYGVLDEAEGYDYETILDGIQAAVDYLEADGTIAAFKTEAENFKEKMEELKDKVSEYLTDMDAFESYLSFAQGDLEAMMSYF